MSASLAVVGHGAAGLSAALAAAEDARERGVPLRITLLERAPQAARGGGTRWSPCNVRMRSTTEMAPDFEADMQAASGGRADAAYFRRLAEEAPASIAWLESHGVGFHRPGYYLSAAPPRIQPVGGGAAVLEGLERAAHSAGIEIRYDCEAQALARDARGVLAGVEALQAGRASARIEADAVVLASGGFEGSADMRATQFGPGGARLRLISPGTAWNTGSGIRMALAFGAQRAGDWNGMHIEPVDARSDGPAPVVLVYPYGIVVDRAGRRFFDEGAGLMHETWEALSRAIHFEAPGGVAWVILDAALHGIGGWERAVRSDQPPVRADTIESLAAQTGLPRQGLAATLSSFNAAAQGDLRRFDAGRADGLATAPGLEPPKSNWARPLVTPPYLAWPLVGALAYTFGGLATDTQARVLGDAGPIPGLYAAGEISGHFHGTAPNAVAFLRALVYGRIAGRNAARFVTGTCAPSTGAPR